MGLFRASRLFGLLLAAACGASSPAVESPAPESPAPESPALESTAQAPAETPSASGVVAEAAPAPAEPEGPRFPGPTHEDLLAMVNVDGFDRYDQGDSGAWGRFVARAPERAYFYSEQGWVEGYRHCRRQAITYDEGAALLEFRRRDGRCTAITTLRFAPDELTVATTLECPSDGAGESVSAYSPRSFPQSAFSDHGGQTLFASRLGTLEVSCQPGTWPIHCADGTEGRCDTSVPHARVAFPTQRQGDMAFGRLMGGDCTGTCDSASCDDARDAIRAQTAGLRFVEPAGAVVGLFDRASACRAYSRERAPMRQAFEGEQ